MAILLYDLVGKDPLRPFSPHCWKTKMMFADLGHEYLSIPTRFTEVSQIEGGKYTSLPTIRDGDLCIQDSFEIARHYADGGSLIGGSDGEALVRFTECWSQTQLHSWMGKWAMLDIHNMLDEEDQHYFRTKREKMFGVTLEELIAGREDTVPELLSRLMPMKLVLSRGDFIGGAKPNFADYIVFGAFQWLRVSSSLKMIPEDHVVMDWFKRCQDLHDGLGHSVTEGELTI